MNRRKPPSAPRKVDLESKWQKYWLALAMHQHGQPMPKRPDQEEPSSTVTQPQPPASIRRRRTQRPEKPTDQTDRAQSMAEKYGPEGWESAVTP